MQVVQDARDLGLIQPTNHLIGICPSTGILFHLMLAITRACKPAVHNEEHCALAWLQQITIYSQRGSQLTIIYYVELEPWPTGRLLKTDAKRRTARRPPSHARTF